MSQDHPILSVVIPVKDEAKNIEPLAEELTAALNQQSWPWECIWVDDGSTDQTLDALEALAQRNSNHRYISFEKNAGQSAALFAGFQDSRSPILATLDGDGQNDPSDIPQLVTMIQSGKFHMVNGYRQKRQDTLVRKLEGRIANTFRNWVTGNVVRDVGCSTRVFRRECIEFLPIFQGMHRFLPTLVAMRGFRVTEVPVNHRQRKYGVTKYGINDRLWVGLVDTLGVLWLKKRGFHFNIDKRSRP